MSGPARVATYVLVIACLVFAARHTAPRAGALGARSDDGGATYRLDAASARRDGDPLLDATTRAATFTFDAGTSARAQAFFRDTVAGARPEAQRLIGLVDGLVLVRFAPIGEANAVGLTSFDGTRYEVTIDIDRLLPHGTAALQATILHELGHVVDRALVSDELVAALDAKIPTGVNCVPGQPTGACAPVAERFADTFAKWAMDDLGVNGTVGYRILPPVPLAGWGAPLAQLGAGR